MHLYTIPRANFLRGEFMTLPFRLKPIGKPLQGRFLAMFHYFITINMRFACKNTGFIFENLLKI